MKRMLSLVLSAVLMISLAGCGGRESAEDVVKNAIEALKSYDTEKISAYWGGDSAIAEGDGQESEEMLQAIFEGITYEIVSSKEEETTASVEVKISNLDMSSVMGDTISELFVKLLGDSFSGGEQMSEEEQEQLFNDTFLEKLKSGEYETVEKTVTVSLTLTDKKWTIDQDNNEAYDALTGGMLTYAETMGNAFSAG